MEAQHRDEYDVAAQYAYSGGNSFCDISSGSNRARELDAACKQQHDLLVRVVDYFINRAVLDQIIDGATDPERADDSFRDAVRLLSFEKAPDVNRRCCGRSADEDILRLLTSKAHFLARYVRQHREESVEKADNMEWRQALDALRQAAQLASPETAPRRFQRIANDWLMLYKDGDTLCRQPCYPYSPRADVDWRRYAVYLHSVLGEIEEISRGSAD
jgi:hypothetical protein